MHNARKIFFFSQLTRFCATRSFCANMGNPRKKSARKHKYQARLHKSDTFQTTMSTVAIQQGSYIFLDDKNTHDYLRKTKIMFIMRGLPGSGKTSIVTAIGEKYKHIEVCSTDENFRKEDGTYEFNRDLLGTYHESNQDKARRACTLGISTVIIDNTNVKRWEMQPYMQMALQYNYIPIPVIPQTPWSLDPAVLATKNKHGVEVEILEAKLRDFLELNPTFYGWFMNEAISLELKEMGQSYFEMCRKQAGIPNFLKSLGFEDKPDAPYSSLYTRNGVLHCTASYIGKAPTENGEKYMTGDIVKQSLHHIFPLKIIGLIITPRTVGARVELNKQQFALWNNDQDDDPNPQQVQEGNTAPFKPFLGNPMPTKHEFEPMDGKPAPKAHITLGCAEGIQPVQTGPDLLKLVALEEKYAYIKDRYFELPFGNALLGEGTRVRYYGPDNGYVVYFEKPFVRKSIFSFRY